MAARLGRSTLADMDPRVQARITANGGLITRREALGAGLAKEAIGALLRAGEWVTVRHGVYARVVDWDDWDAYVERPRQRARAVHLTTRTAHVFSHDSGAHLVGLPVLRPDRDLVHLTRPRFRSAQVRAGVKHHGARYLPSQVRDVDGIPVLDKARIAVDMAREYGVRGGLPTFDAALRVGVTRSQLWAEIERMRGWPDVAAPRICAELADPGAETVAESLGRELLHELGLGEPDTQFPVRIADGRVMWCDIRIGCHVFEVEGRIKLTPRERGGVADRDPDEVRWRQRQRERDVCAEGLGMSFLFWSDYWGEARQHAKARLQREWEATVQRHGTELPHHLAEFARRIRGERSA
jgi:IS1 family transposase